MTMMEVFMERNSAQQPLANGLVPGTAVVTGATSGFGRAIARSLHGAGFHVVALGRRQERLEELAATLGTARLWFRALDVRDQQALATLPETMPHDWPAVSVLVNNAGLALGLEPAQRAALEDWETMVDTNIKGMLHATHAFLPGMAQRGRGHVVNMGSVAAHYPYPGGCTYGGTKAFVAQFGKGLRCDLLGTGVRVTTIEPGMCETEFSQVRFKGDKERAAAVYQGTKPLSADDVAQAVLWVIGQPLHVNINSIELMPVCQAWGPFAIHRS
jgi:NADP-dependent 3-hydroxy acid dehydrogenase YdfG